MAEILSPGLLEALERRWRAAGALYVNDMAPGLRDEQIDAIVAPVGVTLPEGHAIGTDGMTAHLVTT